MVAAVAVYPSPDDAYRSPAYTVTVIQDGQRYPSFTYRHGNPDEHLLDRMSDSNHWTTFSFEMPIFFASAACVDITMPRTAFR